MAKSTFCRRCSQYFAITPSNLAGAKPPAAAQPTVRTLPGTAAVPRPASDLPAVSASSPAPASGLMAKFEGLLNTKPKSRIAQCFECNSAHEVSSTSTSSTCKACGAYIDLQDYKISGSFSRNIKTRGTVYLGSKGDLSSSKVICDHATIHGKMRGNLHCAGRVTVRVQGRLFGTVEAGELLVEKGSEVIFSRPIKTMTAEIHGHMSGQIVCGTHVTIYKTGLLDGAVEAAGFTVEKGGCYQGELTISPRQQTATGTAAPVERGTAATVVNPPLLGGEQGSGNGLGPKAKFLVDRLFPGRT